MVFLEMLSHKSQVLENSKECEENLQFQTNYLTKNLQTSTEEQLTELDSLLVNLW